MKMTYDEYIQREVQTISNRYNYEDTPELRALGYAYNSDISEEARSVHRESLCIDTCTYGLEDYGWDLREGGMTALNCTVPETRNGPEEALRWICDYHYICELRVKELMLILEADDILRAKAEGKCGAIIGAQSCEFSQHDDLEASMQVLHRAGLRVMQIGYNHRTFAADGCATGSNSGLTREGKILVRAMQKVGITVDLSHAGEKSTLEAMDLCELPPIFSHSNPKALYNVPRNITDQQAKRCAELGGVVGVCSFPALLWAGGNHFPTIDDFIRCVVHFVDLVGVDHVGVSTDTIATAGRFPGRTNTAHSGPGTVRYASYLAGRGFKGMICDGIESMANYPNIAHHLLLHGFHREEVKKILGGNFYRVFKETWKGDK